MLTVLHTLANSAGLFSKNQTAITNASANPSQKINKALQNLHIVRKIILTQNLPEDQEQAALTRLDQILDQISVNSLSVLTYTQIQDLAAALTVTTTTTSKELTQILSTIRSSSTVTTTTTTKIITKTINGTTVTTSEDDNVSVTSSEGPSSAVTVVDELDHLSLSVRSNIALGIQGDSKASALQLTSGNLAVEHVAYALSDLLFVYPSSASQHSYLGHGSEQWAKAGLSNATNSVLAPQVLQMSTRANAASAVLGAVSSAASAKATSVISTLASSAAIVNMVPNLYQIAQANRPVVFHVTAESVDSNLNVLRGDYSDVLVARETGLLYLASNSVQEAYNVSVLAHAVAAGTNQSVIHILDGVKTSQQVEAIKTVGDQALAAFVKQEQRNAVVAQDEESLVSAIEGIFDRASALLGHSYKAFEYTGPKDAETVVVVYGPAANVAHHLGDKVTFFSLLKPYTYSFNVCT
jgi:sulfite reductase (NADPH) flavoprotein alpha-component